MSELAAVDFDRPSQPTATEIVNELRSHATEVCDHVDSIRSILGDDLDRIEADGELRESVRRVAHQRYVGAREHQQRLLAMLNQAEERLATESRIFAVLERLTCSPR